MEVDNRGGQSHLKEQKGRHASFYAMNSSIVYWHSEQM